MNNSHRYLVQYMLRNGIAAVDNVLNFCKQVSVGQIENMTQFETLLIELNREISKQHYKIVFNKCEVTDKNLVIWVNTKNDDISKQQIFYSEIDLEYFHAILQEILSSEEYRITFIACINITSTLTNKFSRDNGQKVLNKWQQTGYYVKSGDFIHLGPRLIIEFTSYLRSHCPNAICNLCSELVFTGKKCSHCNTVLHSYCILKYLENLSDCPCCKNTWEISDEDDVHSTNTDIVDEIENIDETMDMQDSNFSEEQSTSSQASHRLNRRNGSQSTPDHWGDPGPSQKRRR